MVTTALETPFPGMEARPRSPLVVTEERLAGHRHTVVVALEMVVVVSPAREGPTPAARGVAHPEDPEEVRQEDLEAREEARPVVGVAAEAERPPPILFRSCT